MQLNPVTSSNIAAVGYENGKLRVQFNNGRTYEYSGVEEDLYDDMMLADSVGRYFNANIKNQYETQEV